MKFVYFFFYFILYILCIEKVRTMMTERYIIHESVLYIMSVYVYIYDVYIMYACTRITYIYISV